VIATQTPMTHPSTQSRQEAWELDPQHCQVEFAVRHMMISTVRGRFHRVSGVVFMDPAEPATASAEIRIEAASIDSGLRMRDDHLRSNEFLDAESYPVILYRTTRIDRLRPGTYVVQGELSIRGIVREVPLLVESAGLVTDPWGTQRAGFSASTRINRTDFGLTWNAALETGGVAVGDEVTITIDVELLRASRRSAA
jgi:polyisoprenoid-binding protein YceI